MNHINNKGPISLHIQIRNEILGKILNGLLEPGDKLASEKELCKEFDCSRTTVRLALTHLSQRGLIYSKPGKGSFVAPSVMNESKKELIGFFDSPNNTSIIKEFKIFESKKYSSLGKISSRLQIPLGEKIFYVLSLRKANNNVIGFDKSYLPYQYMPELIDMDLEGKSLDETINSLVKNPLKVEQMIHACSTDKEMLNYLGINNNIPMMCIEKISYLVGEIPIEYRKSFFKGDSYRLNIITEKNKIV